MAKMYLVFFLLISSQISVGQSLEGTWAGNISAGGHSLKFIIHIDFKDGKWSAKADSPQQGAFNIPSKIVYISSDSVVLQIQGGMKYAAKLNTEKVLKGRFEQGVFETNLDLFRSKKDLLIRSQLVIPPYSYDTTDVKFPNKFDRLMLSGTITYPKAEGKFPAVVLVTGSGPQDRNHTLFGHEPFKVLADYLTRNNIVVLRYDDRGVGASQGNFNQSNIEDFSGDVLSAIDFLKTNNRVDSSKIGILGHSEGGLISFLLAGQHYPTLSFIVSIAGPAVSIDDVLVKQLYKIGKLQGLSDEQLAINEKINAKNFSILKSEMTDKQALVAVHENMKDIPEYTNNPNNEVNQMIQPSFRHFMRIEPESLIKKIKIPVFAAYGGLDVQVDAHQNMHSLQVNLPKNKQHQIIEYPKLNHLFQTATTGNITEYGSLEESFNAAVMTDIVRWIQSLTFE